jgi:long-chain acyl-CoA synthetase
MTVGTHPSVQALHRPEHPANVMMATGQVITYGELDRRSMRCSQLYRSLGLQRGDTVAVMAENHERFLELYWAAQRSGLYFTPVSLHLTDPEVTYILRDSGARVLVVSDSCHRLGITLRAELPNVQVLCLDGARPACASYEDLVSQQPAEQIADESAGTDMLYTSGTTGLPKGVRRPLEGEHFGEVPKRFEMYATMGWGDQTVQLSLGPLYHSSPLHTSMVTQFLGGTNIIPGRFDAEATLQAIERYHVTHLNVVPTHLIRLLRLDEALRNAYDLSSLQLVMHGAAPCPIEVKRRIIDWFGPIVTEYYGGTEGLGGSFISSEEWLAHPGSVGQPILGQVHVVEETTWEEVPTGTDGMLYFETAAVVSYHNAPEKSRAMRSPQGWATFGDIGRVDEDGYIYLTDRRANLIISGGVNIYPQEAENRLLLHPLVADAAVFGAPHEDFGEEPHAVVQLVDGHRASPELAEELIDFCREALSPLKCPKVVTFSDSLPRGENGKLYKQQMRLRLAAQASGTPG